MYDNILIVCDGVPGVDSSLDSVRQGIATFENLCKYNIMAIIFELGSSCACEVSALAN